MLQIKPRCSEISGPVFQLLIIFSVIFTFSHNLSYSQQEFHGQSTPPYYISGINALHDSLMKKINFPTEELKSEISGIVEVSFLLNQNGQIEDVKIMRGIDPVCDSEAVRVIRLIPGWQPARQLGKPVCSRIILPVEFHSNNMTSSASPIIVSGTVIDRITGRPVEGSLIVVKGTFQGTISDSKGRYRIDIPVNNNELEFSSIGYQKQSVEINGNATINIELNPENYIVDFRSNEMK